jgi:hypothetical protein
MFLTTNSHGKFLDTVCKASLGDNWHDLFDLIITKAKKPLFFSAETPFTELDSDIALVGLDSITKSIAKKKVL